jgi:hypothetical protein
MHHVQSAKVLRLLLFMLKDIKQAAPMADTFEAATAAPTCQFGDQCLGTRNI